MAGTNFTSHFTELMCEIQMFRIRRIAAAFINDEIESNLKSGIKIAHVSTVFLSVDHSFGFQSTPILFETMIFGGILDQYQARCPEYCDAVIQHWQTVNKVLSIPYNESWLWNRIKDWYRWNIDIRRRRK